MTKPYFMQKDNIRCFSNFVCLVLFLFCSIGTANEVSKRGIYKQARHATVLIVTELGQGSGFFVQPNLIVTNFHVIEYALSRPLTIKYRREDQQSYTPVRSVLGYDEERDLAILEVPSSSVKPLVIGDSDSVEPPDTVYVAGHPRFLPKVTISIGNISAIYEVTPNQWLQFTAPTSAGSSGGPVLNERGEVIGVVTWRVRHGEGLNFATPSKHIRSLLRRLDVADLPKPRMVPPQHPPNPRPPLKPSPLSPQELLQKGIEYYKQAQFKEAIDTLQWALVGLRNPAQRATACLYLGCSRWGFGAKDEIVIEDFQVALRLNPYQKLPRGIGNDHPVFKPMLERAREESIGSLTITASLPVTQIWIGGNLLNRRLLGTGTASVRLFKGNYTVECIFEKVSKLTTVRIKPGIHQEFNLEMPPILKLNAPSKAFLGQSLTLTLHVMSAVKPKQVEADYAAYDLHGNELMRGSKGMLVWKEQSESFTWVYQLNLPSPNKAGKIRYFIKADEARTPETQYYQIFVRSRPPEINPLDPPDNASTNIHQSIAFRVQVRSIVPVDEVRVYYDSARAQLSESSTFQRLKAKLSSDTYIGEIPVWHNLAEGDIWYFVTATNVEGTSAKSEIRMVSAK